jgi:hypothetical protein
MCFDDSLSFLPFVNDSFPGKFMLHWHALQGSPASSLASNTGYVTI